jgi:hypothetical protein
MMIAAGQRMYQEGSAGKNHSRVRITITGVTATIARRSAARDSCLHLEIGWHAVHGIVDDD